MKKVGNKETLTADEEEWNRVVALDAVCSEGHKKMWHCL
jgi:hypothetical protein